MSSDPQPTDPAEIAAAYFDHWRGHEFDQLQALLAEDVSFEGPLATVEGATDCRKGLEGMAEHVMADIVVHRRWADGEDVITWFDLHTKGGDVLPTANWSRVVDGRIVAIRVAFDARPVAPPSE